MSHAQQKDDGPVDTRVDTTACILCSRNCGLEVTVHADGFSKIKGDPKHPDSQGYICQKAARLAHYQKNQDRLTSPLKRQPDESFKPIDWDTALTEIAQKLNAIRQEHGGKAFALLGGGGQGNHVGGAYNRQITQAMQSRFTYTALAQEKTGDFWVNGRLFGRQNCHPSEDVTHADYIIAIGTNPYQSHGIHNARDTLKAIQKDPNRTLVVIDPRRTETAEQADIHLQVKPSTDAYLMLAMLGTIVQENRHNIDFLKKYVVDYEPVLKQLREIPIETYVSIADVSLEKAQQVARDFAAAKRGCVRVDLGLQHSKNTTLNSYLEKLLYLITGHFGREGCNNLHTMILPLLGHNDERKDKCTRSEHHQMFSIAGMLPPNILPDEILLPEEHIRAILVDSCNPLLTYSDSKAYRKALDTLDLLVVVDVAMTETAQQAHYVLPADSQFEKWEATGFNLEFPKNFFHLRHPLFKPTGQGLPEPEIYTRLLIKMGIIQPEYPFLSLLLRCFKPLGATLEFFLFFMVLGVYLGFKSKNLPFAASILYMTYGKQVMGDKAAVAPLIPLCMAYAQQYGQAVKRTGIKGNRLTLGWNLFQRILDSRSGTHISEHTYDEMWTLLKHPDQKIHLSIPEMMQEIQALPKQLEASGEYPLVLVAGERRSYNANQIYRDPSWRKVDPNGFLRIHPDDAKSLEMNDGEYVFCESSSGSIPVMIKYDDSVRCGVVTLPHGYGNTYNNSEPLGPRLNDLTLGSHCDPLSKTPFHKFVQVRLVRQSQVADKHHDKDTHAFKQREPSLMAS